MIKTGREPNSYERCGLFRVNGFDPSRATDTPVPVITTSHLRPTSVHADQNNPQWTVPDGFDHAEAHLHAAVGMVLPGLWQTGHAVVTVSQDLYSQTVVLLQQPILLFRTIKDGLQSTTQKYKDAKEEKIKMGKEMRRWLSEQEGLKHSVWRVNAVLLNKILMWLLELLYLALPEQTGSTWQLTVFQLKS